MKIMDKKLALLNNTKDIKDDYQYARKQYYALSEYGQEAVSIALELAKEVESPRAIEALSAMIKTQADVVAKLMELQKDHKEVSGSNSKKSETANEVTNNNLFVGGTEEMQRMLFDKIKTRLAN